MPRLSMIAMALTAAGLVLAPVGAGAAPAAKAPAAAKAVPAPSLSRAQSPESVGFDSERLARLDAYMKGVVAEGRVAGMTTLLARHGRIVSFRTYGKQDLATGQPVTEDTLFRIYSMSKPITGVALMMLFEEGKWRLDDPVTRYVPEFKTLRVMNGVDNLGRPVLEDMKRPPTMRELMSHTAGFGYGLQDEHPVDRLYREKLVLGSHGLQEMIDRTATIPLVFQPGTAWRYSSAADIQGYIVEKLSGQTFGQFLEQRLFRPLRMKDTAFWVPPAKVGRFSGVYDGDRETGKLKEAHMNYGFPLADFTRPPAMEGGGGGLVSSTMDYARFCQMILNKGELDGARILSPAAVELMGINAIPKAALASSDEPNTGRFTDAIGFGLDFMVVTNARKAGSLEGDGVMSWTGAAGTWFWIDPTNDLFFVGMIQRTGGGEGPLGQMSRTLTYQALTRPEK